MCSSDLSNDFKKEKQPKKEYLLVDGYNIIFAWEYLKELAEINLEGARNLLADILCDYQGFKQNQVILVFDAYRVTGNQGEIIPYHNIHIVYTKEAETADAYIEKTTHSFAKKYQITVATSDALEQRIIMGHGAIRMSAQGLKEEIDRMRNEGMMEYQSQNQMGGKQYLFQDLSEDLKNHLENIRLGISEDGETK